MDKSQPQNRTLSRSIPAALEHLFIAGKDPAYMYWMLGAITLIGLIVRIWRISQPIAYDEAYSFIDYATRGFKHILADYSAPNNHIFHTLLVRFSYEIFGRQPWVVRVPALLAGMLCIPAAYLTARRISNATQSLAAAALIALVPWFINYSVNGRGYTLVVLFSLLLANFGALLIEKQTRSALAAYAIAAALGFYTIPIFLYPMAGISLWVLVSHLTAADSWKEKTAKTRDFLITCALAGLMTLLLYSPVILFGTGFRSIVSNEIVESRQWQVFAENLRPRAIRTWESWMQAIEPPVQYILLVGFLVSVFFYRKASSQRLPLQIFLVLGAAIMLVLQRVAPLARVWLYLEAFYLIFAAGGLIWLLEIPFHRILKDEQKAKLLASVVLLGTMIIFTGIYRQTQQGSLVPNRDDFPEQFAAGYLASHLQAGDIIVSISPVDIQTAYYLYMHGVPYDVFYQRDHPGEVKNGIIVLRTNSKYNTPQAVLDFYQITENFDLASAQLLYEYGPVQVFSIPSK